MNENEKSDPSNEDRASEPCSSAMAMTLPVLNATALTESGGEPVVTKYYFAGGKRVAMDREGVVQWLVVDHLGTTSLVLNADGTVHSEARHYPYGEERWSSGTVPTDYRFTGQRSESGLRLIHMGARHYDYALGRWISADTIVPNPTTPQSFNRYAYVRNSPLRYTDPSGHADWAGEEESGDTESRLPQKGSWEFLVAYIRYQAYEAQESFRNITEQLGQYEDADSSPPIAVWTWDDGQGLLPGPNPHFQLRDDLDALNDILLLGTDVTADGLTIFGHGLLLASGASVFAPPPGDELLEVTGAFLFLNTAFGLDVLALADTAASRGINSEEFFVQAGFVGADAASGRVAGTYLVQLVVAATDVTVDVFGDSAGLSEKYGSGLTFYEWYQLYGGE